MVTDRRGCFAALDGTGAARRSGLASDLEGSGGRKKGQSNESDGGDAGEHVGVGEAIKGVGMQKG